MHPISSNPRNNPDTDKYVRDATHQYLNSLQTYPTELKLKSIEILLKLVDSIIKHPYIDKYRLLNISSESLPMTFRQPFSIDFLKRIGFIEEYSDNQQLLCYCYSSTIPTLLTVQSTLKDDKQGLASDNFGNAEKVSLIQRTNFDNFLKYREILTQDLLKKESRSERVSLNLSLDEMRTFCAELGVRSLQDILLSYYKDPVLIENTVRNIVYSKRKADALLLSLKDFWEEMEFIRTSAFYIYQCFSDRVSKSYLSDVNDPNSQFARRILSLSLVQTQSLIKITDTKICTVRGLLIEFMNWYCLADDDPDKATFPEIIESLSLGREKGPQFVENLELILCEKLVQQVQAKAMRLRAEEYKSWCITPPSFSDLPERNPTVDFSRDISKWFQPHIIDTYFAMTYSAQMLGTQMGLRVSYDKNKLLVYLAGARNNPTDFFSQAEASDALQTKVVGQNFNMKNVARTLYKNTSPASLFAAILNKHLDLLKEFMRNDLYLNIRDHKKRTLLHYAAFAGSIDITELLLQRGMSPDEPDDLGKTPFDIAYEGNFYEGNISVCSSLIKSGVNPPLKVWEVLIDYALTSDNVTYLELALRYDVPFVPTFHASLLRIPIKHQNPKVLRFIGEKLDHDTIRKFALIRDQEDKNALDYAYETRNEDIIDLVEKVVGTDSASVFPTIIKNQEAFIKNNQDTLEYNIRFIKEREAKRKGNSQIQGQAGTQLPTTLTMLANHPSDIDFPRRPPEKRNSLPRPNYSVSDFDRSYQGTTNLRQLPPLQRPSLNDSLRHSSPQKRPPSGEFKSLRNGSPAPRSANMSGYDLSPDGRPGQKGSGYALKYPPERELVTGDLNDGMETLLATLKKKREDEQSRLKVQRENGCNVS